MAVSEQMCFAPLFCRARSGECCELVLNEGRVFCPLTCTEDVQRQDGEDEGYSMEQIFYVTLASSLLNNIFMMNFNDNDEVTTTPSTPAPITTTTTSPVNSTTVLSKDE